MSSLVQSLSRVQLFATPWTAAHQALLFFTVSWSLLKYMSIESVRHPAISSFAVLFSFCFQSIPASGSFPVSQLFASSGQSIGASAWASVLPMNIQDWFPLGFTGLISLLYKGLSRVFFSTTVWKHQFFGSQPSLWYNSHIHTRPLGRPELVAGPFTSWLVSEVIFSVFQESHRDGPRVDPFERPESAD